MHAVTRKRHSVQYSDQPSRGRTTAPAVAQDTRFRDEQGVCRTPRHEPADLDNFEKEGPLSIKVALMLNRKLCISLDWLYFGEIDGLPVGLARRLGVL